MIYKNTSFIEKTFHGVLFKPGDVREVNGYINDPTMVKMKSLPKEPPAVVKKSKIDKQGGYPNGSDSDK